MDRADRDPDRGADPRAARLHPLTNEEMIDVLSRAAMTPMPRVPCPRCDRGTVTGPNGESWRCSFCNGMGRVYAGEAEGYAQVMSEHTVIEPDQPDQPEPEADPTAPEPEPDAPEPEPEPEQPEPEPAD